MAAPGVSLDSVLGVFLSIRENGTWHSFVYLAYPSGVYLYIDENNKASYCHHLPRGIMRTNEIIAIKPHMLLRRRELNSSIVQWVVLPLALMLLPGDCSMLSAKACPGLFLG